VSAAADPGVLIAFEGLDQSGKETQARRQRARLVAAGFEVLALSFPCYRTRIAHEIASALSGGTRYAPDVLQLLYVANRFEYKPQIQEALARGAVVICDRYLASSVAYGEAFGLDPAWLADAQRLLPRPTLTVLLDIAPETAVARKAIDRDRFERDLDLLGRVRASYLRQATQPGWVRIDGERSREDVDAAVTAAVMARLGR
jgi:dTMP kinase